MTKSPESLIGEIKARLAELERSLKKDDRIVKKQHSDSFSADISDKYDLSESGSRWMTCAAICSELGIEPTPINCNMMGKSIPKTIPRRRSNGRNLLLMPPLLEKF